MRNVNHNTKMNTNMFIIPISTLMVLKYVPNMLGSRKNAVLSQCENVVWIPIIMPSATPYTIEGVSSGMQGVGGGQGSASQ